MKKRWIVLAVLLLASTVAAYVAGRRHSPPAETVYLPEKTVTVEVVDPETLARLAVAEGLADSLGLQLDRATGQLRDAKGRLAEVRQLLSIDTGPVESPEPVEVVRVVREACESGEAPVGRIRADLAEFGGLDAAGDLAYGWAGEVACDISADGGAGWAVLASSPLTLANTRAVGSTRPEPARRPQRWYSGVMWSAVKEANSPELPGHSDVWRVYGGRQWLSRRAISARTGVFLDQSGSAGLDMSFSF